MTAGVKWIGVVKSGKDTVSDLLDNEFLVSLSFFASPEDTLWVSLHVINIRFCVVVLIVTEGDREAGLYSLCFHTIVS